MPYGQTSTGTSSEGTTTIKTFRRRKTTSSRLQRSYEDQMKTQKTIYVHRNGYNETPTQIFFTKKLLRNMSQVLDLVQEKIVCERAVVSLHKLNGLTVDEVSKLQPEGRYVAVEQGQRFKRIAYDEVNFESSSPRREKLPAIKNGGFYTWRSTSEGKSRHRLPSNESSQEQSSKVKPKLKLPVIKQRPHESRGFEVIYGYPRKENEGLTTHRAQHAHKNDKDKQRNAYRSVFYATGGQSEKALEIRDDKRVRVEKPLDMIKARKVHEELYEVDYPHNGKHSRRDLREPRSQPTMEAKKRNRPVSLPQLTHQPNPPPRDIFPPKPSIAHPRRHTKEKHKRVEKRKEPSAVTIPKSTIRDQRFVSQDNNMANTKRYFVTREQRLFDMHGRDGRELASEVMHVYEADARIKTLERKSQELEKRKRIEEWVDHTVEEKQKEDEIAAVAKQLVLDALSNASKTLNTDCGKQSYLQSSNKVNAPSFCDNENTNGVKYHRVFGQ